MSNEKMTTATHSGHEDDYAALLATTARRIAEASRRPLFVVDTDDANLNGVYLGNIPEEGGMRAVHNCSACRRFLNDFGSLATISEDGTLCSALWGEAEDVPTFYRKAVGSLRYQVERGKVKGPFLSATPVLGTPKTGDWTHFSVVLNSTYRETKETARQKMASMREDYGTVYHAITTFDPEHLKIALQVFENGLLDRSEKFVAPIRWLLELQTKVRGTRNHKTKNNLVWLATAIAPSGYCHPRASVTGSLLEDLANGFSLDEARRRFNKKVGGTIYQRPQAAPKRGAIAKAEEIVAKLGLERSLERRFASLEEVPKIWEPKEKTKPTKSGGVFGHLIPNAQDLARFETAEKTPITWEKFAKTILPSADEIEALVTTARMAFVALTTAYYPDAPPIIRWDRPEARNPVSWYVYTGGSYAGAWSLLPGWTKVSAVVSFPNSWGDAPHLGHGEGIIFALDGADDRVLGEGNGNVLFPEHVRGELHETRSVIEAYAKTATLRRIKEPRAIGLEVRKGGKASPILLKVRTGPLVTNYLIDRWD